MRTFDLHTNNKIYRVAVRGAFSKTITTEKKLITAIKKAAAEHPNRAYGKALMDKINTGKIHEVCNLLGILSYSCPKEPGETR